MHQTRLNTKYLLADTNTSGKVDVSQFLTPDRVHMHKITHFTIIFNFNTYLKVQVYLAIDFSVEDLLNFYFTQKKYSDEETKT